MPADTNPDGRSRVAIVDDHVAFAEALSLAIGLTPDLYCVATISASEGFVDRIRAASPGILICDQHLTDGTTGIALLRELHDASISIPTMLLTGFPTPEVVEAALSVGATVVAKETPLKEIVIAVRHLRDGMPVAIAVESNTHGLSPGELRVLQLLGHGQRAADIAEGLNLSVHTVRDHIKAILRKLGVSSQLEAVIQAQRLGLIAPPT